MKKPLYTAKKSGFSALNIWLLLFFGLIIPLIIQIWVICRTKSYKLKFYEDRVVKKVGIIFREESQTLFMGVNSLNVEQGFWGDVFDYGTVHIVCPGAVDLFEEGIFEPHQLKRFLQSRFVSPSTPHMVVAL